MGKKNVVTPNKEESNQQVHSSKIVRLDRAVPFDRLTTLWGALTNDKIIDILNDRKVVPHSVIEVLAREVHEYPDGEIQAALHDEDGYESYKYIFLCKKTGYRQLKDSLAGKSNDTIVFNLDDIETITNELNLMLGSANRDYAVKNEENNQNGMPIDVLIENFRMLQMALAKHDPNEPMASPEYLTEILTRVGLSKSYEPDNAAIVKKFKANEEWAKDVEIAAELTAKCAVDGKKRSTEKHKELWKELRKATRTMAFRAFRRGLPESYKEEGPSRD